MYVLAKALHHIRSTKDNSDNGKVRPVGIPHRRAIRVRAHKKR